LSLNAYVVSYCKHNIYWPDKIANKELWKQTGQEPVLTQLRRRKWYLLRINDNNIAKILPNKDYSVHLRATVNRGPTKEHVEKRSGERNGHSRFQVQLDEYGGGTGSTGQSWMETSNKTTTLHRE